VGGVPNPPPSSSWDGIPNPPPSSDHWVGVGYPDHWTGGVPHPHHQGGWGTEGTSRVPDKISPGKRKHQGIVDDFDIISQPGSVSGVGDDGKVMDVQNYFVILEKNVLTFFLSFSFFLLENSFDYKLSKRSRNEEDSEDKSGD